MYKVAGYKTDMEYRIGKLLVDDRASRDALIALGLVPGEIIKVVRSLFRGRYWVIQVRKQLIGLRLSELQRLQLHELYN